MKKHKKYGSLLFLIALVVSAGIVYFAVDEAYSIVYSTGEAILSTCYDSDGGLDYKVAGYVLYKSQKTYDTCSASKLIERYCSPNILMSKTVTCPEGFSCSGGKCVCKNECTLKGQKQCYGANCSSTYNRNCKTYRVCGNYDSDACLEWSTSLKYCEGSCYQNKCIGI